MAAAEGSSVGVAVRTLFIVLGCVMVATLVYTIVTDGLPFRMELLTRWMTVSLIDFYIQVAFIGAWVVYKESSLIMAAVWIVLLVCLGSIATCAYIVMQFFKLSPEESSKDPVYFVLVRRQKRDVMDHKRGPSVVTARVIFAALSCLVLGLFVYAIIGEGFPFRADLWTPWMLTVGIDFCVNAVAISVWIAYKESSWIIAFFLFLLLACFGSTFSSAYIVRQLFYLSPQEPLSHVLFRRSHRHLQSSDQPLMVDE